MKEIIFKDLVKSYDNKTLVLDHLNLKMNAGERVILLGPSGCGKSTILRIIAGLEDITAGQLIMDDRIVNDLPPSERNISMVFQNYALYPHMTVKDNIAYGLRINKVAKQEIDRRVDEVVGILELTGLEGRKPKDLSGGQRQRVALARAIVKNSDYFLLDEPLSNLDAQLRLHARQELVKLHERFKMTFVYVTHDQVEAMTMGEKIILLNEGHVQMVGSPYQVYNHPRNVFTARFIGSPPMNILKCKYIQGSIQPLQDGRQIALDKDLIKLAEQDGSQQFYFGIRPEDIEMTTAEDLEGLAVAVKYRENYGSQVGIYFNLGSEEAIVLSSDYSIQAGDTIYLKFPKDKIALFNMETELNLISEEQIDQ